MAGELSLNQIIERYPNIPNPFNPEESLGIRDWLQESSDYCDFINPALAQPDAPLTIRDQSFTLLAIGSALAKAGRALPAEDFALIPEDKRSGLISPS